MPSLPTSLIIVGLVAAWLVVLVPMVAKRREHVPESDEDGAGFRILRRNSAAKRRPVLSRTAVAGDPDDEGLEDAYGGDEVAEWDGEADEVARAGDDVRAGAGPADDHDECDEAADEQDVVEDLAGGDEGHGSNFVRVVDPRRRRNTERRDEERVVAQDELPYDEEYRDEPEPEWRREPVGTGRMVTRERRTQQRPRYEERHRDQYDDDPVRGGRDDDRYEDGFEDRLEDRRAYDAPADYSDGYADRRHEPREGEDAERYRPVPVRPGRGGFDPQAAERAKAYRYRQRRRIVLTLLVIAVLATGAGLLGISLAWAAVAVAAVLLALYLAYLRRQVRIEEDIRRRRAARLERARQIRPVYRASVAEQVRVHRSGGLRRPEPGEEPVGDYRVVSHARPSVPPQYYTRGVPVDLDDDDPAFDNLEYYRAVPYRRAVGE
jgi:hypothetical protein